MKFFFLRFPLVFYILKIIFNTNCIFFEDMLLDIVSRSNVVAKSALTSQFRASTKLLLSVLVVKRVMG